MFPNLGLQSLLFGVVYNLGTDLAANRLAATFQYPHNGDLILSTGASDLPCPFMGVHIPRLAADVRFIRFDLPRQLVARPHTEGKPNPMVHEPRGFLGDVQRPRHFATAHAVLAVCNEPRSREPCLLYT